MGRSLHTLPQLKHPLIWVVMDIHLIFASQVPKYASLDLGKVVVEAK